MTKEIAAEEFKDKHRVAIQSYPFTVVGAAFLEGALWAIKHSPEVLKLVETLEWYSENKDIVVNMPYGVSEWRRTHHDFKKAREALAVYRKSVGEP